MDIRQLIELYLHHTLLGRASYLSTRRLVHHTFRSIQDAETDQVTPLQLADWFRQLGDTPIQANKAMKILRAAYKWGAAMRLIDCANPTMVLRPYREVSRDRTMTETEWVDIEPELSDCFLKFQAMCKMVFLTGCRPKEARLAQWVDLFLDDGLWHKDRTKNGRTSWMPLPVQLVTVLRDLRQHYPVGPWVFQGQHPDAPWCESGARACWARLRNRLGIRGLRLYDLRRSFASDLDEAGVTLPTIQHSLTHASLQHTATYVRVRPHTVLQAVQDHADRRLPVQRSLFTHSQGVTP